MKKVQFSLMMLSLSLITTLTYAAPDGTITINGKVMDQTCTIGGTDGNYIVTLPSVSKSTLATANSTNGDTLFSINLSNCPVGSIGIYFDNSHANINSAGRLKNTVMSPNAAANVDVQLLNSAKTILDLTKDASGQNLILSNVGTAGGNAKIDFYARYFANAANVTAGGITTTATYYVIYP